MSTSKKQLVAHVKAELPLVEEREQLLLNELAVLLGKPPGTDLKLIADRFPDLPDLPAIGLPADLLFARPDICSAARRLEAADWQIAAARANRLPAITLSAHTRYSESSLNTLFDTWLLNLSANLTAPLLDSGYRKAEVDRTRAVVDQKLAIYRETVMKAVKEVEDALVRNAKQATHIASLQQVIDVARKALDEASAHYCNGVSGYLPVLSQLLSVQSLETKLMLKQKNLLFARISLYRALGGTWPVGLISPVNQISGRPDDDDQSPTGVQYE